MVMSTEEECNAATLARWMMTARATELHVRDVQRQVRRRTAQQVRAAIDILVEADWLRTPVPGTGARQHGRIVYAVNPRLWEAAQ